ncbi:hypothetical protein WNY37_15850 [Henriciella sp. AS95]|uniref:hypothetical protein n=1 Tax=Henriciella sp. AS95 TaxID=3135782 RepID=UPI00317C12EA
MTETAPMLRTRKYRFLMLMLAWFAIGPLNPLPALAEALQITDLDRSQLAWLILPPSIMYGTVLFCRLISSPVMQATELRLLTFSLWVGGAFLMIVVFSLGLLILLPQAWVEALVCGIPSMLWGYLIIRYGVLEWKPIGAEIGAQSV